MSLEDSALAERAQGSAPLYNKDILRLAVSIPHMGRLDAPDASSEKRSVTCGSRVVADVRIDEHASLSALGLEISACALGQASASVMANQAIGKAHGEIEIALKQLEGFLRGERTEIGDWPDIEKLASAKDYPARHPSILLPFRAVCDAMQIAIENKGQQ